MRLTMADYAEHVAKKLLGLGVRYKVTCMDILFDIYTLFADSGAVLNYDMNVLYAMRVNDPAGYYVERDAFFKQCSMLEHLPNSDIFQAISDAYGDDPLKCVEELIKTLQDAVKAAQNNTNHSLNGGRISASNHGAPPSLDLTALVTAFEGLCTATNEIVTESTFNKSGGFPYILSRDSGSKVDPLAYLNAARDFVRRGGHKLYSWIANLQGQAGFEKRSKKETDNVTDNKTASTMDALSQVVHADMAELARPDVDKKIAQKELVVNKYVAEDKDKAHSIVLLDVSSSMRARDCAGGRMDRLFYAVIIVLAILDRVIKRGDVAHLVLFESSPLPVKSATDATEAQKVVEWLLKRSNHGGGTDIQAALGSAFRLMNGEAAKYRHCDIVLITDGESYVSKTFVAANRPQKSKIRTIQIGGGGLSNESKSSVFELSDEAVAAGWDYENDCPALGKVLEGV